MSIMIQLASGDLTFAANLAAQKIHVVKLRDTAFDDDVLGLSKHLSKEVRAKRITEIASKRKSLWNATSLCGVQGSHSAWGNSQRYYWEPRQDPSLEVVCKGCMREWKKLNEPEINGWDRSATHEDPWVWELPFGWQAVEVKGHPWDCATAESAEQIKDDTGKVVGEHRVELRRWVRGPHIVRLVHHLDSDSYSARHWIERHGPNADGDIVQGTLKYARQKCQELMARGGY